MKKMSNWENQLKKIICDDDGLLPQSFGHNCDFDITKYLRRIEKLSKPTGRADEDCLCDIKILDYYSVRITLPPDYKDGAKFRENILFFILTTAPMPSACRFNKKKDQLTLEWHY